MELKERLSKAETALLKIDGLYGDNTDAARIVKEYFESIPIEPPVMQKIAEIEKEFYKEFTETYEEDINYNTMNVGEQISLVQHGWELNPKKLQQTAEYIKMKNVLPRDLWNFIGQKLSNFSA